MIRVKGHNRFEEFLKDKNEIKEETILQNG
jgi:hypothetical protein